MYKGCVNFKIVGVDWCLKIMFWNLSLKVEMQTQNVLDIFAYKKLLPNNILHISFQI